MVPLSMLSPLLDALRAHLRRARKASARGGEGEAEAIHALRTGFKRLRATWRLLRPALSAPRFRRENRALREAARTLAPMREAIVLRDTFARLAGKSASREGTSRDAETWETLEASLPAADPKRAAPVLEKALASLSAGLDRFEAFGEREPDAFRLGKLRGYLGISYRKARKAGESARAGDDEGLHAWRKRVKDHAYHLEAARALLSARAGKALKRLDGLQESLGRLHDLEALEGHLRGYSPSLPPGKGARRIGRIMAREKAGLGRRIHRSGRTPFHRKPGRYLDRLGL
ncbi:MAG TPA: CHAD domain-containing protein [Fibrobacteria bacterium]|nr:CHAD domain-containing protein [Fibrobacteria bacterium]